eukprot:1371281-Ditylum_brightwellii.AAC.1
MMGTNGLTVEQGFGTRTKVALRKVKQAGHKEEYGLIGKGTHTFAANAKILNGPNVFIGHTGATSDTTNSKYGFVNVRKAASGDSIIDASGNGISGNIVGDIKGT